MNKPTLDKVRNYFYGRCNDGEEVRIQQWFADNGNSSEADRLLGALLDEVRSENPALAQAAFEEFCRRIGHSVPARTAPRRLTGALEMTSFQSENYKSRATGGGFYFFNESLDGITAQLARCFDQKIIITDPELAGVRFYAFFTNNESLLKILGTLNTDKSMSIRERNDVIYISRKK